MRRLTDTTSGLIQRTFSGSSQIVWFEPPFRARYKKEIHSIDCEEFNYRRHKLQVATLGHGLRKGDQAVANCTPLAYMAGQEQRECSGWNNSFAFQGIVNCALITRTVRQMDDGCSVAISMVSSTRIRGKGPWQGRTEAHVSQGGADCGRSLSTEHFADHIRLNGRADGGRSCSTPYHEDFVEVIVDMPQERKTVRIVEPIEETNVKVVQVREDRRQLR